MLKYIFVKDILLCFALLSVKSICEYCPATIKTKTYVWSCPESKIEWENAAQKKNCSAIQQNCTTQDNFVYHCLRNNEGRLLEVCSLPVTITFPVCPQFNEGENFVVEDHFTDCSKYNPPCPSRYDSIEAYKYPGCFNVSNLISTKTTLTDFTSPKGSSTEQSTQSSQVNKIEAPEWSRDEGSFKKLHLLFASYATGIIAPLVSIYILIILFARKMKYKKKYGAADSRVEASMPLLKQPGQETAGSSTEGGLRKEVYRPHGGGKIKLSSIDSLLEYARTLTYENINEKHSANLPEMLEEMFIRKLGIDVLRHVSLVDNFTDKEKLARDINVPKEVLNWDHDARCRYMEYAKTGTQTRHIATVIIVGCHGSGKTILNHLQRNNFQDLKQTQSTIEADINVTIFKVDKDLKCLKEKTETENEVLLNVLDFGGHCAYYACHQVNLSRRAFYLLVIDMSRSFHEKVDETFCDEEGIMFHGYTYGEFIKYWLKMVHLYSDNDTPVVIFATNCDGQKTTEQVRVQECRPVYDALLDLLKSDLDLKNHLDRGRCFGIASPQDDYEAKLCSVEECLVSIAEQDRWQINIPKTWTHCKDVLIESKRRKILSLAEFTKQLQMEKIERENLLDALRFFSDIGMILHFNESHFKDNIIPNVQYFADSFRNITNPKYAFDELEINGDCQCLYKSGFLSYDLFNRFWEKYEMNPEEINTTLKYMQHLGLLHVATDDTAHYVPCLNKLDFGEDFRHNISSFKQKSSVLVFNFQFLPHCFYFRLIVACMVDPEWSVIEENGQKYLFKNVACFKFLKHVIALAVTPTTIQAQILSRDDLLCPKRTQKIRNIIEDRLKTMIKHSHKKTYYTVGYQCSKQNVFEEQVSCFLSEKNISGKGEFDCPNHRLNSNHSVHEKDLLWNWNDGKDIVQYAIPEPLKEELANLESQIDQLSRTMRAMKTHCEQTNEEQIVLCVKETSF